ncbi:NADH-ubiquinone oxidoreductase chain C [hydrothermal vent metagenome]|uniref:NADH-ubiquinone oxidoreductase chain C n=1 Tax=hydrothermal vent metagenome TaxID=652676 RepID=A0A3B0V0U2_9ZZZZ
MSIVEQTRIALLELFPDLAAADAEARAKAEAEAAEAAEALAPAEAEQEVTAAAATGEAETATPPPAEESAESAAPEAEAAAAPAAKEPVEEGPRQNGVAVGDYDRHGVHLDVLCDPQQVVTAAEILDQAGFFIEAITGVDWLKEDQMEVIYDYNRTDGRLCRVVVRTRIPRAEPELPSIANVYPGANWHEREAYDFFGIRFRGHPDLTRILLPEDADFYPLLKDFTP